MTSRHRHFEVGLILVITAILTAHGVKNILTTPSAPTRTAVMGTLQLEPHGPYRPKGINHSISWTQSQDLWLIDPDSGKSRVIPSPGHRRSPAVYAPDGQALAYFLDDRLKVANADATNAVDLTPSGVTLLPGGGITWSPDSGTLAVQVEGPDRIPAIGTIDRKGFRMAEEDAGLPIWSPDGKQWLFARGRDLYTTPAGGGARRKLTEGLDLNSVWDATWCPDGRHFAFCGRRGDHTEDVYLGTIDGADRVNLTRSNGPGSVSFTSWSPTSDEILYQVSTPGAGDVIRLQDVQTGVQQELARESNPRWSPDGQRIIYAADSSLMIMHRDGSLPRALLDDFRPGPHASIYW